MLKRFFLIIFIINIIYSSILLADNNSHSQLNIDYNLVCSNINNKIFLRNYSYNIINFAFYNYDRYKIKNDKNSIKKFIKCLTAVYNNNPKWNDVISKINYYREMAILTNIISEEASIIYYKKFLYLIFKAEEGLKLGKLKLKNLDEEICTYRFTAIKVLYEHDTNKKSIIKLPTIKELNEKSEKLRDKLFCDDELINSNDINNLY